MPILRDDLLAGRMVAGNVTGELRGVLASLGATLEEPGEATKALVHDARDAFGDGGPAALQAALEATWEAVAEAANTAFIPSGRGGKIILIAPEDAAGIHAEPAQAAVENLARTLSTEWARYGITTTAVTPRAGTNEADLAMVVAFLLSGAGDYYSGSRFELGPR
jgi:NAD(P)-dependent dehydrogenase (short-subunit alcohol dehydrogenase family)